MPKRSNEFQVIVYLVKKCLAEGAVVIESAELTDRQTGDKREVDVTVTGTVAGHEVLVALECIDWSRPATVEWVEQMETKHSVLPTSLLVLVSRSGFSKRAVAKARFLGILPVGFDDAPLTVEAGLRNQLTDLRIHSIGLTARSMRVELEVSDGESTEIEGVRSMDIYTGDSTGLGDLGLLVDSYLQLPRVPGELMAEQAESTEEHTEATLVIEPALNDGCMSPVFMMDSNDGSLYRVRRLVVLTGVQFADHPLEIQPVVLGDKEIVVGKSKVLDRDFLMVAALDQDGRVTYAVRSGVEEATGQFLDDDSQES